MTNDFFNGPLMPISGGLLTQQMVNNHIGQLRQVTRYETAAQAQANVLNKQNARQHQRTLELLYGVFAPLPINHLPEGNKMKKFTNKQIADIFKRAASYYDLPHTNAFTSAQVRVRETGVCDSIMHVAVEMGLITESQRLMSRKEFFGADIIEIIASYFEKNNYYQQYKTHPDSIPAVTFANHSYLLPNVSLFCPVRADICYELARHFEELPEEETEKVGDKTFYWNGDSLYIRTALGNGRYHSVYGDGTGSNTGNLIHQHKPKELTEISQDIKDYACKIWQKAYPEKNISGVDVRFEFGDWYTYIKCEDWRGASDKIALPATETELDAWKQALSMAATKCYQDQKIFGRTMDKVLGIPARQPEK